LEAVLPAWRVFNVILTFSLQFRATFLDLPNPAVAQQLVAELTSISTAPVLPPTQPPILQTVYGMLFRCCRERSVTAQVLEPPPSVVTEEEEMSDEEEDGKKLVWRKYFFYFSIARRISRNSETTQESWLVGRGGSEIVANGALRLLAWHRARARNACNARTFN
jgi:hypothetical protein